jgi:hypothetical protein
VVLGATFVLVSLSVGVAWMITNWTIEEVDPLWIAIFNSEGTGAWLFIGAASLIAVVVGAVTKLLTGVVSASSIWLGFDNPKHNLYWTVHAQRWPGLGSGEEVRRYSLMEVLQESSGTLLHSRLYTNPRVIGDVAEWMHQKNIEWKHCDVMSSFNRD